MTVHHIAPRIPRAATNIMPKKHKTKLYQEIVTHSPTLVSDPQVAFLRPLSPCPMYEYPEDDSDDEDIISFCVGKAYTAYKRVDKKVKPVPAVFPEDQKVTRRFPEDPLKSLPPLPVFPPEFTPNGRLTQERLEEMNLFKDDFLWPEEKKLFTHIIQFHQNALVFEDNQRGSFREDYFSPYIIPTVAHVPWTHGNIPIPPGIRERVIQLLQEKIAAGVYEPCQSSYRSRWFCVLKKNGKLRIVHDLQPLNAVSIKESGLPPNLDSFVEPFAGRQCYTVMDLYWGFDARKVHPKSRDLTAFQTPLGLLRITSLPTGFTNSPAEFQACMSFILQEEMSDKADIFIDDLAIRGTSTMYPDEQGNPEVLKENPKIRRFIWEHALDVYRILHRVSHAGGTFSPTKIQLATPIAVILGHKCTPEGRSPDDQKVEKILKWPPLTTVKEVRGFLGLCGTVRIWIQNYSLIARPLTELVRKDEEFVWDERREEAFQTLKQLVTTAPALKPIDYTLDNPVVLSVDSSFIAVGFILSQEDEKGRKRPARYGSIPMNEHEARYSQPKLELYGLFRALRAYRLYLIGVKNLKVEVDAQYIKGMLNEPDLHPSATENRWIQGILLFDFKLVHVPATRFKGPDALSRRHRAEGEVSEPEDDGWVDDIALYVGAPPITRSATIPVYFTSTLSKEDQVLNSIQRFLTDLEFPSNLNEPQRKRFIKRATKFFVREHQLYKRNGVNPPLRAITHLPTRYDLLQQAHEDLGHRGEQPVFHTLHKRFYWPNMWNDVRKHVSSCLQCQHRNTMKLQLPVQVSTPTTLFSRVYIDVMRMPLGKGGYTSIVAARDDLSGAAEGRALISIDSESLKDFFWEDLFCRYGAIQEITTDNGSEVQGAFKLLMKKYGLPQTMITPYNSRANGVVERGHFTIREAIIKTCKQGNAKHKGHYSKKKEAELLSVWPKYVPLIFFADRITVRRSTNVSPFFVLHGTEPLLPFDLSESSFLSDRFTANMTTEDLLAARMLQLEKRDEDLAKVAATLKKYRLKSKEQFEERFENRLCTGDYPNGSLVLIRNISIEKSADRKYQPRYLGPYKVVRRTRHGSYVLEELNGVALRYRIAPFRVLPYFSRTDTALWQLAHDDNDSSSESD